jgi:hypothetical protein
MQKNYLLCLLSAIIFVNCDAHMQRSLELYKPREEAKKEEIQKDKFILPSDDVDMAFSKAEIQAVDSEIAREPVYEERKSEMEEKQPFIETSAILLNVKDIEFFKKGPREIIKFSGDGKASIIKTSTEYTPPRLIIVIEDVFYQGNKKIIEGIGTFTKRVKVKNLPDRSIYTIEFFERFNTKFPKFNIEKYDDYFSVILFN